MNDKFPLRAEVLPPSTPPHEPPDPPSADRFGAFEQRVGKRWITWAGSLAVFVAMALFFKMWVDTGHAGRVFTPLVRVVLGGGFGLALLYAGQRAAQRSLRALGQGLLGTGLAVLYLTVFAGLALYHLYPREVAFALLIAITSTGTVLAVRHDALPIALLSVIGGLVTPLMLSTGEDHRDALLAYVTILDLGVLAVALRKGWRALDWVAFAGTWILFGGWYVQHYQPDALAPTMAWLTVLFGVFAGMPFAFHLHHRRSIDDGRFAIAIANALVMIGGAHALLSGGAQLGVVSLGMAGVYTLLGALTRRRLPDDGRAIFGFIALAMVFLTLTVPLMLERHGITLGWAIEGPVLLALGLRHRYYPARLAGLIVLGLAALRLLVDPMATDAATLLLNAPFLSAMCVPLAAGLYAAIHQGMRRLGDARDRPLQAISALGAGLLAMVLVHLELARAGGEHRAWAVVAPWVLGSFGFLWTGARVRNDAAWVTGLVTAVIAGFLGLVSYGSGPAAVALYLNARFLGALGVVGLGFAIWRLGEDREVGRAAVTMAIAALWLLLSVETYGHFAQRVDAHGVAGMALTFVWGAFAIALIATGFGRHVRGLRLAGLALFGLTAGKLVLVDLATVHQGYRVLSFLVIGLLMITSSYLYHRLERGLRA